MTELAPKVGGWVEFYRSPARKLWTPTGINVPEYGSWLRSGGRTSPRASPARKRISRRWTVLARDQDEMMARLEKSGAQGKLGPKMNKERDPEYWYARPRRTAISRPSASSPMKSRQEKPSTTTSS